MDREALETRIRQLVTGRENDMAAKAGRRDILPLFADREALEALIPYLAAPYRGHVDCVCAPESLGFIVGSMLARELGVGFVGIRRNRQFPADEDGILMARYIDHRDQVTSLSTGKLLLPEESRVLLADNWIETAATLQACMNIIEDAGCRLAGIAAVGADYRSAAKSLIDDGLVRCVVLEK